MKRNLMTRLRSPWWWAFTVLFLLSVNFMAACGSAPNESRVKVENKDKETPDEKK